MLSVADIAKRRAHLKQIPPGFTFTTHINTNNNYSKSTNEKREKGHVTGSSSDVITQDPIVVSKHLKGNADFIAFLRKLKSGSDISINRSSHPQYEPQFHMKPVIDVARKRARCHPAPPGFKQLPVLNVNNNARNSGKKRSYATIVQESNVPNAPVLRSLTDCIKGIKSEILLTPEEMDSLKPACLKGENDDTNVEKKKDRGGDGTKNVGLKQKLKSRLKTIGNVMEEIPFKKKKQKGPVFETSIRQSDIIDGQEVVINGLTFDPEEQELFEDIEVKDITPDGFLETFEYFEMITENRKQATRAIYMLGDMLLAGEIEGDREEWETHTIQLLEAENAWKKRCRDDDAYFEIHHRSIGAKISLKTRMREYAKDKLSKSKKFFNNICPCLFSE